MGCVSSKKIRSEAPVFDPPSPVTAVVSAAGRIHRHSQSVSSGHLPVKAAFGPLEKIKEEPEEEEEEEEVVEEEEDYEEDEESPNQPQELGNHHGNLKKGASEKKVVFSIKFGRLIEGEHAAAGWPAWLTAVAGEAIEGWSNVYRARDVETGKIFALKKVRFDNFEPESVRFMAREIIILRKLDHPNIMKLEGVITSRLSCSIYLVFEYMEHDLSGLLSCPEIKFTESQVEQLHKIFKLCGTPPDEYWRTAKLPLATMFKPQNPYESTLRERCKEFPKTAVRLIETFLSIEPYKRGTVSSALNSMYFHTKPYASDPSSLPKFPPNKEIDAKIREEERRKRTGGMSRTSAGSRNSRKVRRTLQEQSDFCRVVPSEEGENSMNSSRRNHGGGTNTHRRRGITDTRMALKSSFDTKSEAVSEVSQTTNESHGSIRSVPAQATTSHSYAWTKRQNQMDIPKRYHGYPSSRGQKSNAYDPSSVLHGQDYFERERQEDDDLSSSVYHSVSAKRATHREQTQLNLPDSFQTSDDRGL